MFTPLHPWSRLTPRQKRARMHVAVPYFLAHKQTQLGLLNLKPNADARQVMAAIRASAERGRSGHWTFCFHRHLGLQQAYVALRYEALLERHAERRAA